MINQGFRVTVNPCSITRQNKFIVSLSSKTLRNNLIQIYLENTLMQTNATTFSNENYFEKY